MFWDLRQLFEFYAVAAEVFEAMAAKGVGEAPAVPGNAVMKAKARRIRMGGRN